MYPTSYYWESIATTRGHMEYPDYKSQGPAPCTAIDPEDFFPDLEEPGALTRANEAKKACADCPYLKACFEWAMENNEVGIWGGSSENDRRKERIRRVRRSTRLRTLVLNAR